MAVGSAIENNPIIVEYDIYEYLTAVGQLDGWTAYVGLMPDKDDGTYDNCISIFQYTAYGAEHNLTQRPNFQILIRAGADAGDYILGRTKAQKLLNHLMNFGDCDQLGFTINEHRYVLIVPITTAPTFLGRDERGRPLWSLNFNCYVEYSPYVIFDTLGSYVYDTMGNKLYNTSREAIDG